MNSTHKLTIKDIAKMAETSQTTVSFYLNGKYEKMSTKTKDRIEEVIRQTNYSPSMIARSLTTKKTNLIGVIVADITSPFSSSIVDGIDKVAREEGYQIIVASGGYDFEYEEKFINRMLDIRVDGFIVQSSIKFVSLAEKIKSKGIKIVLLDSVSKEYKGQWVKTNNTEITNEAVTELAKKGYNNFIMIAENPNLLVSRLERVISFQNTLNGLEIQHSVEIVSSNLPIEEFKELADKCIDPEKKNLLFAINGKILKKIYDYSKILNYSIPKNVGIIGFDEWEWSKYATPKVTTIGQPNYEEGKQASRLLINMIKREKEVNQEKESYIFPGTINWNDSTNIN